MLFIRLFHEYTQFFIGAVESEHKWTCSSNRAVMVYNRQITVKVNLRLYLSAVTRFTRLWTLNKQTEMNRLSPSHGSKRQIWTESPGKLRLKWVDKQEAELQLELEIDNFGMLVWKNLTFNIKKC